MNDFEKLTDLYYWMNRCEQSPEEILNFICTGALFDESGLNNCTVSEELMNILASWKVSESVDSAK